MKLNEIKDAPKWAGIYYIKNELNNKYYIGQSKVLRKRLLKHISNFNKIVYDTPLYRAFKKYGLDNFEFGILEEFKIGYTKEELDLILDTKEKEYIKRYNSYGNTGYNQTYGGDKGINGYKFTNKQKIKHVETNIKVQNDGRNKIYAYDINTKCTYMAISLTHLNKILNTQFITGDIRNLVVKNKYLLARSIEDLEIKKEKYNNLNSITRKFGKFQYKLDLKEQDIQFFKEHSNKEIMQKYNICSKTIYNYKHLLNII